MKYCFVDAGVPKGSIIDPLVFIICVNDLSNMQDVDNLINLESIIIFFEDDTVIETSARAEDVVMKQKTQLKNVISGQLKNKISVNTEKTKSRFFGKTKKNIMTSVKEELKTSIQYVTLE